MPAHYPPGVRTFRVATFNVHHCAGLDGRVDIERTAQVINALDADLVALQELDEGMERSGRVDQPAELERLIGMRMTFHPTLERGGGRYGIAIASRSGGGPFEYRPLRRVGDEEPRGYLVGPWNGVTVLATHLSLRPEPRDLQTAELIKVARGIHGPVLLLGDLNQSLWRLRRVVRGRFSVGLIPRRTMVRRWWSQRDHIVGGGGLRVAGRFVRRTSASDHLPLAAEVEVA